MKMIMGTKTFVTDEIRGMRLHTNYISNQVTSRENWEKILYFFIEILLKNFQYMYSTRATVKCLCPSVCPYAKCHLIHIKVQSNDCTRHSKHFNLWIFPATVTVDTCVDSTSEIDIYHNFK